MKYWIVAFVAVGILAGCGDSGPSSSAPPPLGQGDLPTFMTSGTWAGTGTITVMDPNTRSGVCPQVQMTVMMRSDSLHLEGMNFNCDLFFSFFGPYDAEIRGGELWNSGERIGTIDSTGLSLKISRLPASLQTFDLRVVADGKIRLVHHDYSNSGTMARTIDHTADLTFQPQ